MRTLMISIKDSLAHNLEPHWVTIHKVRDIYIRRGMVPQSEVYSSIFENFHLAYTSVTE